MRIVWTARALRDLQNVFDYQRREWPGAMAGFERRLSAIEERIRQHPLSAQELLDRPGVRVVPFVTHPYNLFYRASGDSIEILHLRHSSREEWK